MSVFEKFRKGAQKVGTQATAFVQASSTKLASESRDFAQTFSLPGEAEKAAKILDSFLGKYSYILADSSSLNQVIFTYRRFPQRILNAPNRRLILSPKLFYNGLEACTLIIDFHHSLQRGEPFFFFQVLLSSRF